ncbi:MAG: pectin esterase [Clostridia bacterium]|nr:pectin esterase [Clostridia bacterium]
MKTIYLTPADDIQSAVNALKGPATVYLKSGIYRQKVKITSDDITIIGEDREKTVITFDDYARKPHADGREYNTFRTYTLLITGNRVRLENLTVENSNAHPEKDGQCVALSVNGDGFVAENVDLKSMQDTLFTAPFPDDLVIRYSGLTDDETYYDGFIPKDELCLEGNKVHLFKNCRIYGTVDYVFGCAEAYFLNCEFISLFETRGTGFVAAPAHSLNQSRGYVFLDCSFKSGGAAENSVYLARPWRDFGKCEFINCKVGGHIAPELFDKWNDTYRDKTARFSYYNLESGLPLAPVKWSSEMTSEQATEIINYCNAKFKGNVR